MIEKKNDNLNEEKLSLFNFMEKNKRLTIINAIDDKEYKLQDIVLPLKERHISDKNLVFLYLDSGLISISYYLTFLNSNNTLVLLSDSIKKILKENLEKEYAPYIVFDQTRKNIKNYKINYLNNKFLKTIYFLNNSVPDINIHENCKILLSTSGTTGSPKFVKLSETNILENAKSITNYLPINEDDVVPINLPLYYSYGLSIFNSNSIAGGKIVCGLPDILERNFWKYLNTYKFTSIAGVPFVYEMLKRIGFLEQNYPSLTYITQAGGNLSENIKRDFYDYSRNNLIRFFVMYGQTEATARISYVPDDKLEAKITSIGIPIKKGELAIDNITGELLYSGPNIFGGYASKIDDLETWENIAVLKTGDIAIKDNEGYFYIKGRIKRFVKLFGNRLNLDEIENFLKSSLNISLLACLGINDRSILIAHNIENIDELILKKQLFDLYKIHSSSIKIKFFKQLPKTQNGKIDYKKIATLYIESI